MTYLHFLKTHRAMLSFGLFTALSSSFGQTFFISLFLLQFQQDFGVSKSGFGFIYATATVLAALLLPHTGARIDTADLGRYTAFAMAGLALSALMMSLSTNVWMLGASLLGLRLLGQGLLGHISQTVMAREFSAGRGTALGVAGIGYPLGEAVLPILTALLLARLPWRGVWILAALLTGFVLLPLVLRMLRHRTPPPAPAGLKVIGSEAKALDRSALWRDSRMYMVLPSVLVLPFVFTGLFLYQAVLAGSKGWALEWMAAAFAAFAISRVLSSLAVGPLIDRFSATRLLPVYLIPLAAGLLVVWSGKSPMTAFAYMALAGVTAGASGSVSSAVWAELYGAHNVGKVRSAVAALSIVSTAASPALIGSLFQFQVGIGQMLIGAFCLVCAASALSLPVARRARAIAPVQAPPQPEPALAGN